MHIERTPVLSLLRRGGLAALLGLAALGACQPGAPLPTQPQTAASDEPLLRTYTVPPEHARSIMQALQSALSTGKDLPPHGTVEQLPNGQLVVVASAGIHDGIAELIKGLDASRPPLAQTAAFNYWVVVGEPAAEASGLEVPDIAPALAAIVREQGPMKFTLLEQAQVASLIDERAEVKGDRMEIRQVITAVGGRLVADIGLEIDTNPEYDPTARCRGMCKELRTRVHVDPGQLLVVGQTGVAGPGGAPRSLFYLVRGQTTAGG